MNQARYLKIVGNMYVFFLWALLIGIVVHLTGNEQNQKECVFMVIPILADIVHFSYLMKGTLTPSIIVINVVWFVCFRICSVVVIVPYLANIKHLFVDTSPYHIVYDIGVLYFIITDMCVAVPYFVYGFNMYRQQHPVVISTRTQQLQTANPARENVLHAISYVNYIQ